jgi:hypothetical protein
MNFSNTRRVARQDKWHSPAPAATPTLAEQVARQAVCLQIGLGPHRVVARYDDPVEAAKALATISNTILEPTTVLADALSVTALCALEAPVAPTRAIQLAVALAHAAQTLGLFASIPLEPELVTASKRTTQKEMTMSKALRERLPESYAREAEQR